MQGEIKGQAHGAGPGTFDSSSVPLRRWEDWERSRLRKIRREEKRRRAFANTFPHGYQSSEYLRGDAGSQYDGSDTISMASSEEDMWGAQVGTYNENSSQYPPPPPPPAGILLPHQEMISTAKTVDKYEMAAMLESGFDDRPTQDSNPSLASFSSTSRFLDGNGAPAGTTRYQLTDTPSSPGLDTSSGSSPSLGAVRPHRHIASPPVTDEHGRGRYGPLGPLDPGSRL